MYSLGQENSQHSMLANPRYNHISVDNYNREILQKLMLSLCVYVTHSLTLVYMEVIFNIQCYILTSKTPFYYRKIPRNTAKNYVSMFV